MEYLKYEMEYFSMNNTPTENFIKIPITAIFLIFFFNPEGWGGRESNHQNRNLNFLLKDLGGGTHFIFTSHLYTFLSCSPVLSFSEVSYFLLTSQNISVQSSVVGLREDFVSERQFIPLHFIKGVSHTLQTMSHCAIAAVTPRPDFFFLLYRQKTLFLWTMC